MIGIRIGMRYRVLGVPSSTPMIPNFNMLWRHRDFVNMQIFSLR